MGTAFGKPGKSTKNRDFIQWTSGEVFKIGQGLLGLRDQNTWKILRMASSWLGLQNHPKEGFPATIASDGYAPGL